MYEEYMQNFLNYPAGEYQNMYGQMQGNYTYNPYNCEMPRFFEQNCNTGYCKPMQNNNLEEFYPEIYKVIYPMVKKVCMRNNGPLNEDTINNMVDEVYSNIETNEAINLNITINNDIKGENKTVTENRISNEKTQNRESRKNNTLNDLIKILILRELLGRQNRPRPYYPPMPNPWQDRQFTQF